MRYRLKVTFWLILGWLTTCNLMATEPIENLSPIRLGVSTSLSDSGLLDYLLPLFTRQSGYRFAVQAVGSGKALRLGRRGEVDGVWVNSPGAERLFVDQGYGIERYPVMNNEFFLVGPIADPGEIANSEHIFQALADVVEQELLFLSRGDDSGTHNRELELWGEAGLDPYGAVWYQEVGMGMAETLVMANQKKAYTIVDSSTFYRLNPKFLKIIINDSERLQNYYSIMAVNPKLLDDVNYVGMRQFIQWLIADEGQQAISSFTINEHQPFQRERLFLQ